MYDPTADAFGALSDAQRQYVLQLTRAQVQPQPQQPTQGGGPSPLSIAQQFIPQAQAPTAAVPAAAPAAAPASGAGATGAEAAAPLYANPWFWAAAAIVGGATGLDHNNIASFKDQAQGKTLGDIMKSPNVNNWMKDNLGEDMTDAVKHGLKPLTDIPAGKFADLPHDAVRAFTAPFKDLVSGIKKLF